MQRQNPTCRAILAFRLAAVGFLCFYGALWAVGQMSFVDATSALAVESNHTGGYWGTGLSVADFNGDGWDDITLAHHEGNIRFYAGNGVGYDEVQFDLPPYPEEAKAPLWADIDNDGDQDLFITYRLAANKLYRNNGDMQFEDISAICGISQASFRSYGASFGDFDNDGLLDLFVANYAYGQHPPTNELYRNLGNGLFEDVTGAFAMGEPVTHSFQGHWVDFNEDGLLDLHLIRDRLDSENRYYQQQEDGSFSQVAHSMGLDLAINAMCTSISDYDRDGDQDLYMSAGMWEGNFFMVNHSGEFTQHEAEEGDGVEVFLTSWGANWLDADNNGWEDLHVCTGFSTYSLYPQVFEQYPFVPDRYFWNTDGVFTEDTTGFFEAVALSFSAAVSDTNADGFPDVVNHTMGEWVQILQAVPNDNHWLRLRLQGTVSNRDGVGAKVRVFAGGNSTYRMTDCGNNYLSQDSRWEHFGLATHSLVDSIHVMWPSGISDVHFNVPADQSLVLVEGTATGTPAYGCTYATACNFDSAADVDDGSCNFSCMFEELVCAPGLIWDAESHECVVPCMADFTGDAAVDTSDLLFLLGSFATFCPE